MGDFGAKARNTGHRVLCVQTGRPQKSRRLVSLQLAKFDTTQLSLLSRNQRAAATADSVSLLANRVQRVFGVTTYSTPFTTVGVVRIGAGSSN